MTTFHDLLNTRVGRRTLLTGLSTAALVGCSKSPEPSPIVSETTPGATADPSEIVDPAPTSTERTLEQNNQLAEQEIKKISQSTANLAYIILMNSRLRYTTEANDSEVVLYNKQSDATGSDEIPRVQVYYFKDTKTLELTVGDGRPADEVSAAEPIDMIRFSYAIPDDSVLKNAKGVTPDDMLRYVSMLPPELLQSIDAFSSQGKITFNTSPQGDIKGTAMNITHNMDAATYEVSIVNGGDGELKVQQDGGAYTSDQTVMGDFDLALAEAVKVTERAISELGI